jgi:hypothetical protein
MVKTTIMLEDQLYKQLVNEALEEYGSTRKLSLLINRKLKQSGRLKKQGKITKVRIKLGRKLSEKEIENAVENGWNGAVKWNV